MKFLVLCSLALMSATAHADSVFQGFSGISSASALSTSDQILAKAFKLKTSGFMIKFKGAVIRKLPDDNDGSRHQKFIVKLASGQTLLIAHNINLAPRVAGLRVGNAVTIYGEYIWNHGGGIVHKTHHTPDGSKGGGWIRHKDVIYQ